MSSDIDEALDSASAGIVIILAALGLLWLLERSRR